MLLVEDNQLNAEIAAELLKMSRLTVDCDSETRSAPRVKLSVSQTATKLISTCGLNIG